MVDFFPILFQICFPFRLVKISKLYVELTGSPHTESQGIHWKIWDSETWDGGIVNENSLPLEGRLAFPGLQIIY